MTNTQALEVRPTPNVGLAKPTPRASLSERMQEAEAIARAIPSLQPGHILLSMHWSDAHGLDLMTAVQNIAWINGKPNYSAELWEFFAARGGWQVFMAEITPESCTVELYQLDEDPRSPDTTATESWTSTLEDRNPNNKIWNTHPRQMMRGNATRNLVKFHGNTGAAGMADSSVEFEPIDIVDVLTTATPTPEATEVEVITPEPVASPEPAAKTEPKPEAATSDDVAETKAALKASGITQSDAIRKAQEFAPDAGIGTVAKLAQHPEVLKQVLAGF